MIASGALSKVVFFSSGGASVGAAAGSAAADGADGFFDHA